MAQFSGLTPLQQAQIQSFLTLLRPTIGKWAQELNSFNAIQDLWNTTVQPSVALLDTGALISDPTGLSGAAQLTKEKVNTIMTAIGNILTTYNTSGNRSTYVEIAGLPNTFGTL